MLSSVRITVVVDDTARGEGMVAEHGLALWVEADEHRILFDTGQGLAIARNVPRLGIPLEQAEAIVLSHGHYDHTNGLDYVLKHASGATVYMHPAAIEPKWFCADDRPPRWIGISDQSREALDACKLPIKETVKPTEIFPGVWATGEIPRRTSEVGRLKSVFIDESATRPDLLLDDQALFLETKAGLIVLLGCTHAGLTNTLDYIAELAGQTQIHAVIGGTHLIGADDSTLAAAADTMARYQVEFLAPMHCTGDHAWAYLYSRFPNQCKVVGAGMRYTFG